jgi:hypothetical protein
LGGEIAVGILFAHLVKIERSRYSETGSGQMEFEGRRVGKREHRTSNIER